jgi:hypothetical protein
MATYKPNYKILSWTWRSARDSVGIVLIENDIGEVSARIGVAKGNPELSDAEYIAEWGAKLSYNEALGFFPYLQKTDYANRYKKT